MPAPVPQTSLAAPPDVASPADDDVSPEDADGSSGAAVPGATIARPALFSVPSLGIATEVRPVGVRDDGQVAIPADGDLVGWYRFGSAPGSGAGSAVIVGHRDTRAEGPGVFYRLGEVQVGDVITVFRDDWVQVRYRVTSKESITKTALPLDRLFERTGAPRLTVITCGGDYVQGRGYDENIVVTAVPTGT